MEIAKNGKRTSKLVVLLLFVAAALFIGALSAWSDQPGLVTFL